jgi:hypothetical protein
MKTPQILLSATLAISCSFAAAQTITVNWSQDDYVDFGGAQRVANLPGPDGHITFAEAVLAANNTPGPQTIAFAVPRAEWWTLFGADVCYFRHELMAYVSGDDTTIDFTTQTAFTGNTNPNGNEVAFYYAGAPASIPSIWLAGNRITLKGVDRLLGNNFEQGLWITGNNCRVLGCTTTGMTIRGNYGGGANNTIGGTAPGEGNVFSGPTNIISRANGNVVVGNTFRYGLRITGDTLNGTCDDNRIGGPTPAEHNVFSGHGFSGEEGYPSGTELEVFHARNTLVQGNYVGTSDDGLSRFTRVGATGIGVGIGAVGTQIVGNVVGGIERTGGGHYQGLRFGIGIGVAASATGTLIRGNLIGVGVDGVTPILNVQGITVNSDPNGTPSNTVIEDNVITTSETSGVRVLHAAERVRITRNAIFDNGAMAIDLGTAGVTANDAGDADAGPNGLQNFPVVSGAVAGAGGVHITGSLSSAPNRSYAVEFFASPSCDASGHGEGAQYLGRVDVTTNGAGTAAIDSVLGSAALPGQVVTATATDAATASTSEFSACVTAVGSSCPADFNRDGGVDGSDVEAFFVAWESGENAADVNGDGGVDGGDAEYFFVRWEAGGC